MRILMSALVIMGFAAPVAAAPYYWTDWTSATVATAGSASGTIASPQGAVAVTYTGQVLSPTQTSCGAAYWSTNPSIYLGGPVSNGPSPSLPCDMIAMTGGDGNPGTEPITGVSTFSFDRPILNPVMAILSLGQPGVQAQLNFDQPFVILNQGQGYWSSSFISTLTHGGSNSRGGDSLLGFEGHGLIMFTGSFQTLTWTMPAYENWYGFTVGVAGVAPAPGALAIFGLGLLGLGVVRRRR